MGRTTEARMMLRRLLVPIPLVLRCPSPRCALYRPVRGCAVALIARLRDQDDMSFRVKRSGARNLLLIAA